MIWIKVATTEGHEKLINMNNVSDVEYIPDVNLTMITLLRSAIGAIYVKGNYLKEIKRALIADNNNVYTIGE